MEKKSKFLYFIIVFLLIVSGCLSYYIYSMKKDLSNNDVSKVVDCNNTCDCKSSEISGDTNNNTSSNNNARMVYLFQGKNADRYEAKLVDDKVYVSNVEKKDYLLAENVTYAYVLKLGAATTGEKHILLMIKNDGSISAYPLSSLEGSFGFNYKVYDNIDNLKNIVYAFNNVKQYCLENDENNECISYGENDLVNVVDELGNVIDITNKLIFE